MRSFMSHFLLIVITVILSSSQVYAQAGEWTKCIAWSKNTKYNIVYGSWSSDTCFALAQRCTKDPNVRSQYYSNPVVIEAPYLRCTIHWSWSGKPQGQTQGKTFKPQSAFCRAKCQRKAAQCSRGCEGSTEFIKCTDKCDEDWAQCEDNCK